MPNITSKVKIINTIWQINSGCRVYHRHFVRSLPCFAPIRVLEPSQLSANQNSFALAYNWKVASKYFLCALFILVNAAATMHSSELSQSSVPRGMNACKLNQTRPSKVPRLLIGRVQLPPNYAGYIARCYLSSTWICSKSCYLIRKNVVPFDLGLSDDSVHVKFYDIVGITSIWRVRRGFYAWTARVPFCGRRGYPKPYMGTQVFTHDVHNVDVAGFLFCGRRGRLTPVYHPQIRSVYTFRLQQAGKLVNDDDTLISQHHCWLGSSTETSGNTVNKDSLHLVHRHTMPIYIWMYRVKGNLK